MESEKRYYAADNEAIYHMDRPDESMDTTAAADRLNALEAERDAALAIISNRDITYEQMVIELRKALKGGGDE